MKIYVGRWELWPYGALELYDTTKEEIIAELAREVEQYAKEHDVEDNRIGVYTPEEFEAEFNENLDGSFNTETYWIKIF